MAGLRSNWRAKRWMLASSTAKSISRLRLRAHLGDEAAVAGAARGGELGGEPCFGLDGLLNRVHQFARRGQEGLAAQCPVQRVLQAMPVEYRLHALLQALGRGFGGKAEIEVHHHIARDHIGGTRAAVHVADLPAGGREKRIALVPHGSGQLGQGGQGLVNGIARQLRVGNVPLDAAHGEPAAERAAPAVLDHVAGLFDRGGHAHDAVVDPLAPRAQLFDHHLGAIHRRAFFIAGQQERQRDPGLGRGRQEFLDRHDKGRDRGFHVAGAAAVELAILVGGHERIAAPLGHRAGGNHVGMACKDYCFNSIWR